MVLPSNQIFASTNESEGRPGWIYENGVSRVESSNKKTYPYYLDPDFKPLLFNMIGKVAEHIETLPEHIRDRIVVVQAPAGKSGDPQPYAGTVMSHFRLNNLSVYHENSN